MVPYSLDANDMRFVQAQGFNTGEHFFVYLRDSFDALYAEGDPSGLDRPKMMSIACIPRLLGKPGRIGALQRFLDHVARHDQVWVTRRIDIARHWRAVHPHAPAVGTGRRPGSCMSPILPTPEDRHDTTPDLGRRRALRAAAATATAASPGRRSPPIPRSRSGSSSPSPPAGRATSSPG